MSRKKKPEAPGFPTGPHSREQPERLTEEEFERLAAEAKGKPEKVTALLRRVVLETIEQVRVEVGKSEVREDGRAERDG